MASPHFHAALWFLVNWPAHERAADLVTTRGALATIDLTHDAIRPVIHELNPYARDCRRRRRDRFRSIS